MNVTMRMRVYTLATCVVCIAGSLETAFAQQPAPVQPQAAPAPAPVPVQPQAAPAPAPAYPPPTAAAPGAYPPPGQYTYPPPGYPPPGYPPPPGAYAQPQGQYAPGPGYYQEPPARRPRRSRGMMIGGIALLAAGYVPPAIIGIGLGTQERSDCDCRDALRLLIPIVGPLTLWKPNRDLNVFFNTLMVFDTLIQTTGLVLTIFGVMKYNASAEEEYGKLRKPMAPRLTFSATPTLGGAYAGLRLQL